MCHFFPSCACSSTNLIYNLSSVVYITEKISFSPRWYFHNNVRTVCRKQLPDKLNWLQQHATGGCTHPPAHSSAGFCYREISLSIPPTCRDFPSQPGNRYKTHTRYVHPWHKSLWMSRGQPAGTFIVSSEIQIYYDTEKGEKKSKTEPCPDVGQHRHVFAFMLLNLYCKVATLV